MIVVTLLCLVVLNVCAAERPQRVMNMAKPATTPATEAAPAILSIIPSQGEPGSKVMMFGSGFGAQARV